MAKSKSRRRTMIGRGAEKPKAPPRRPDKKQARLDKAAKRKAAKKDGLDKFKPSKATWTNLREIEEDIYEQEQRLIEWTAKFKQTEKDLSVPGCNRKTLALDQLNARDGMKACKKRISKANTAIHTLIRKGLPLFDQAEADQHQGKLATATKEARRILNTPEVPKAPENGEAARELEGAAA